MPWALIPLPYLELISPLIQNKGWLIMRYLDSESKSREYFLLSSKIIYLDISVDLYYYVVLLNIKISYLAGIYLR